MWSVVVLGGEFYVDKIELVESLLADGHYNKMCNSDFAF